MIRTASIVTAIAGALLVANAASASVVYDDFTGAANAAPDSTVWETYTYYYLGSNKQDGSSHLVSNVGNKNASNFSHTVTKADDFDAFSAPLTIQLSDILLGGTNTDGTFGITTTGTNSSFLSYGHSRTNTASEYHPSQGGPLVSGISVNLGVSQDPDTSVITYKATLQEYKPIMDTTKGYLVASRVYNDTYTLAGAPTGLTMAIDGANHTWSITLGGTTFSDTGLASLSHALSADFTQANLSDAGELTARVAFGSLNGSATTTNSMFSVGAINVVPEPASLGLLGMAGLMMVRRRQH